MGIRLTGLNSGLDTEAIVGALMSAQSLKKTKIENEKTKLEWKKTKWQDLNTKLYKLYTEQVSKLQLASTYKTKKATVSDPNKASVTASSTAVNGSYTLAINNIATAQYVTGGKISADNVKTKLSDLDSALVNRELTIKNGDTTVKFTIDADTTIADFTNKLKEAGLNASYDTKQQRFFISGKNSGTENVFSITSSQLSATEVTAREDFRNAVGYSSMTAANKTVVDNALQTFQTAAVGSEEYNTALEAVKKASAEVAKADATKFVQAELYTEHYAEKLAEAQADTTLRSTYYTTNESGTEEISQKQKDKYGAAFDKLSDDEKKALYPMYDTFTDEDKALAREKYIEDKTAEAYNTAVETKAAANTVAEVAARMETDEVKAKVLALAQYGSAQLDENGAPYADFSTLSQEAVEKYYGKNVTPADFSGTNTYDTAAESAAASYAAMGSADRVVAGAASALSSLGLAEITTTTVTNVDGTTSVISNVSEKASGMAMIDASDSEVVLNGAVLKSSSTAVTANGLTIELTGVTKPGEEINFSVASDIDAVYNSVKNFLTEYNEIMKEMNTLYNAESSKGYDPLTSEQKEEMSEEDIKLWEDKIKDSLLRKDTTLNGVMQAMRTAMQSQIEYNGKKYSLASFGIMTSTNYMEGGLYHIYGDEDDSEYASKTDMLKAALEEDPEQVAAVLSGVFGNLRSVMFDKMSVSKVSSALTFYNDKKIDSDLEDYEDQIEEWEDRLQSMEDSYYSKFTAMETALAKLQSQQSSLSGLFGQ